MMNQCHNCSCYDEEFDYFWGGLYGDEDTQIEYEGGEESEDEDLHFCLIHKFEPIDKRIVNDEIDCGEFFSIEEFEKIANHLNDKEQK